MPPKVFVPKHKRKAAGPSGGETDSAAGTPRADSPADEATATDASLTPVGPATPAAASAAKAASAHGDAKAKENAAARTSTGILTSEKRARDIKIASFSLSLYSNVLVEDTEIELNWGGRYGLIGRNGCGKSTFLQASPRAQTGWRAAAG